MKPQSLSGAGGAGGESRAVDPPAEDHSGCRALNSMIMFCSPQLLRDESRGTMEETWCEGEYGASEESIQYISDCDSVAFCFILGSQAGPCIHTCTLFRYTLKRVDVPLLFFLAVMSYCSSFLSSDPLMHLPIKEQILIKSNVTLTFYFHPVSSSIITCMAFQLEVFTGPKIPARTQKAPEMYYPEPNQNWLLFQSWSRTLQELRNVSPKPGWETQT